MEQWGNVSKDICFICGHKKDTLCYGMCHPLISRPLHQLGIGLHHEFVPGAIVSKEWLELVKIHLKSWE